MAAIGCSGGGPPESAAPPVEEPVKKKGKKKQAKASGTAAQPVGSPPAQPAAVAPAKPAPKECYSTPSAPSSHAGLKIRCGVRPSRRQEGRCEQDHGNDQEAGEHTEPRLSAFAA